MAETSEDMGRAVVRLWQDPDAAEALSARSRSRVDEAYSSQVAADRIAGPWSSCSAEPAAPRVDPSARLGDDEAVPAPLAAFLVVLSSAAVLVLEVLVSRLVAPYVGLTLETYTAAIGVALAAIAAGAALGGRLADAVDPRRWLGPATAVGGALLLAARPTVFAVGEGFRGTGPVGTVVLVLLAVAPPPWCCRR